MADPVDRHARQRLVAGFGGDAHDRLRSSTALVAGCGALGCAIADLIVRAGVGRVVLVDRDVVEPTNLQRQTLFAQSDLGTPKVTAAAARLRAVDPSIRVDAWADSIDRESIGDYLDGADMVFDGFDATEPRYLLNDACIERGISWVYCAAIATQARAMLVHAGGPCLRCVWPEAPAAGVLGTCDTAGVLGSSVFIAAGAAVSLGVPPLAGAVPGATRLVCVDTAATRWTSIAVAQDPQCPCCVGRRFEWLSGQAGSTTAVLCGRNAVQVMPQALSSWNLGAWQERLASSGTFVESHGVVRGALHPSLCGGDTLELTLFPDGRAIVHGTADPERAIQVLSRVLGS